MNKINVCIISIGYMLHVDHMVHARCVSVSGQLHVLIMLLNVERLVIVIVTFRK